MQRKPDCVVIFDKEHLVHTASVPLSDRLTLMHNDYGSFCYRNRTILARVRNTPLTQSAVVHAAPVGTDLPWCPTGSRATVSPSVST